MKIAAPRRLYEASWVNAALIGVVGGVALTALAGVLLLARADPAGLAIIGVAVGLLSLAGLVLVALRVAHRTAVGLTSVRQHSQRVAKRVEAVTGQGDPIVAADLTATSGPFAPLTAATRELAALTSLVERDLASRPPVDETLQSHLETMTASLTSQDGPLAARLREEIERSVARGGKLQRMVRAETTSLYSLIEGLEQVTDTLDLDGQLPPLGGWAIRADLAAYLVRHFQVHRPRDVVEAGSGASTVILAGLLRKQGHGHVTALEHDPEYAERTRLEVARLGLEDWATVATAPLTSATLDDHRDHLWYELKHVALPPVIDLLLVDGPPGTTAPLARYPALPLLHDHLTDKSLVLLDDSLRTDEKQTVRLWQEQFHCTVEHLEHLVGTTAIRLTADDADRAPSDHRGA